MWQSPYPPPWWPPPFMYPFHQQQSKAKTSGKKSLKIKSPESMEKFLKRIEAYENRVQKTIDSRKKKPRQFSFLETVSILIVSVPLLGLPYLLLLLYIAQLTLTSMQGLIN